MKERVIGILVFDIHINLIKQTIRIIVLKLLENIYKYKQVIIYQYQYPEINN